MLNRKVSLLVNRAYNFNAGPAALPLEVLRQAQEELVDYKGIGMSIMEISHRSKEYEQVNEETQQLVKDLLQLPDGYRVLFLQGGASTQFAMLPMNLLKLDQVAAYVLTGSWADKALKEAKLFGETAVAAKSRDEGLLNMPSLNSIELPDNAAYLHVTSNETIAGTQFKAFPASGNVPLIGDMSSDILSRPFDASQFSMIYAGAQKNLGPSGVTLVILKEELVEQFRSDVPTMFKYSTHLSNDSLYNTPPVYSVYMMNLVLKWIQKAGGLSAMAQLNQEKTDLIYNVIDQSGGFYQGLTEKEDRSLMNITFKLADPEIEKQFVSEAGANGFVGLKGHRSVGHLRASTYNAVPYESCQALAQFMQQFQSRNS